MRDTWREEFIYQHATARNFRLRRCAHTVLHSDELLCLRLTLSDHHLAAGFSDGSLRLFHLQSLLLLHTFRSRRRDPFGLFSRAITGIILPAAAPYVVFASLDGDVHVSVINGGSHPTRRAHLGDVVNDGTLVDFTGCNRFWVGLYAGVPGRAIHIWDGEAEQLLFVGGSLTDPEAVMGWHLLNDLTAESIGRVRIVGGELAVACTANRCLVFDLRHPGVVIGEEEPDRGIVVGSVDAADGGAFVTVDRRGTVCVRRALTMDQVRRFRLRGGAHVRGLLGAMNGEYVLMCAQGVIRLWDTRLGEYLYSFRERVGDATYLVVSDRYVAASEEDKSIHLWDFGA